MPFRGAFISRLTFAGRAGAVTVRADPSGVTRRCQTSRAMSRVVEIIRAATLAPMSYGVGIVGA